MQARERGEDASVSVRAVRGGLLCDEPGLGKTVTVMALIMGSAGPWWTWAGSGVLRV